MTTPRRPTGIDRYPGIHTRDLEEAQPAFALAYGDGLTLDTPAGAGSFAWDAALVALGPVALVPSYCSTGMIVRGVPSAYLVSISHRGAQRTVTRTASAEIVPGRLANVVSPGISGERTTEARLDSTAVRIDRRFLEAELAALTGRAVTGPIAFEISMPIESGPGAALVRLCAFLLDQIEREAESFAHPLVLQSLCEAMARSLLLAQPHDHAHLLAKAAPPAGAGAVRLVEEYVHAHAADPIGTTELAALAGTSVGALETGFRAHRGTTPQALLRKRRLQLSRSRLLQPGSAPMQDVAHGAGFLRRERFEAAYAAELRETPGETRRRGLVAGGAAEAPLAEREALDARLRALSTREREVCERVSRGMLHKEIAAELGITARTVQVHRGRGMAKLGVRTAAELARLLERGGR
jgi:DNA-binding CsgD family transcriptional regulator